MQQWSNAVVAQIGNMRDRTQMQNARNICELQNTIIACMREREVSPREDMISDLVHATSADGGKLTFEEAVSLIRALLYRRQRDDSYHADQPLHDSRNAARYRRSPQTVGRP